jgi:diaminohydroxyphosphoribosylaminopyrimidine deaminase / 5-amino-6-(5-phosphoribosylamino)uracil reductase
VQSDEHWMRLAVEAAARVEGTTSPNPWVGAVVVGPDAADGEGGANEVPQHFAGATAPPGGPHAEVVALAAAGNRARGGTLYVTLEPCAHHGRTPPCVGAVVESGVRRVVVGATDPDPRVDGAGIAELRAAGITVDVGVGETAVIDQLGPYLKHRRTGMPWVTLKLAGTLDGRIAAADGSSRWITGEEARRDAHRLRARADAVLVGARTVRVDDPALTVRLPSGDPFFRGPQDQPLRVVLGRLSDGARAAPALELDGSPSQVLEELGHRDVIQVLVEGGAQVAHDFHRAGLVDRYVIYLAAALAGGDDGRPMFVGPGAANVGDLWRGRLHSVTSLGDDIRVDLRPAG